MAGVYSKAGRNFNLGKPLNKDLRESIITEIIVIGGDIVTVVSGTVSDGTLSALSKQFRVSKSTVSKLWKTVKGTGSISPKKPPERVPLHHHDFIELQKREKPSISYATICERLFEYSDLPYVHTTTIGNTLRNKLTEKWTRKRLTRHSSDNFSPENIAYMPKVI